MKQKTECPRDLSCQPHMLITSGDSLVGERRAWELVGVARREDKGNTLLPLRFGSFYHFSLQCPARASFQINKLDSGYSW